MIEIDELTKRYGDVVAVEHVSFSVRSGIVTGFLGPNGAGKTTTMRAVLGLVRPTPGR
jgi:ABC-2 type transport system ATP-binding protein